MIQYLDEQCLQCGFDIGLGMPTSSKTDEFSEKFQTAFDPPSFSENHVADFATKVRMLNCKINGTVHIFFLKKSYLSPR